MPVWCRILRFHISIALLVLSAVSIQTVAWAMETRVDPETRTIRVIWGVGSGNALRCAQQDPRIQVGAVIPPLTYETTMADLERSRRIARIYMPRTYAHLVENTDLMIIEIDTRCFTLQNHIWFRDAVLEDGLGFLMGGGAMSFGANPPFTNWCETAVDEILPVDCFHGNAEGRYPKTYMVRLKVASPEDELGASIPWESAPLYYPPNIVAARPGCVPIIVSDNREETPLYFYWDIGEGRSMGVQNLNSYFSDFVNWEFYWDATLNSLYYSVAFPLPDDLLVVHELRGAWNEIQVQRSLLHSFIEFADKYAADTGRLEDGMEGADSLRRSSDSLYLEGSYPDSLDALRASIAEFERLQDLAVELKERALFWVYVIEWLVVSSALMVSGFILWSLMIRRALYRAVRTTSSR